MTRRIIDVRAPDGRVFELMVQLGSLITINATATEAPAPLKAFDVAARSEDAAVIDGSCFEITAGGRERRSTRDVLALVGRPPHDGAPEDVR